MMRCLALARGMVLTGWRCSFIVRPESTKFMPRDDLKFLTVIGAEPAQTESGYGSGAALGKFADGPVDAVVIDHYELDQQYETECREWASTVVAVEDLRNRPHDVDFLILQGRECPPASNPAPGATLLAGSEFAMLRDQFYWQRSRQSSLRNGSGAARRILVGFGSTDSHGILPLALDALSDISTTEGLDLDVRVIAGSHARSLDALDSMVPTMPSSVTVDVLTDIGDVAGVLSDSDLVVGGAGMSAWERCCLGIPSLTVVTSENQLANASALKESGAAKIIYSGENAGGKIAAASLSESLRTIIRDPVWLDSASRTAATLCDGLGVGRILCALDKDLAHDEKPVTLRQATRSDARMVFDWQNSGGTRRLFNDGAPLVLKDHRAWFRARIDSHRGIYRIVFHGESPAGVLCLDPCDDRHTVSLFIAESHRGMGVTTAALRQARKLMPWGTLIAETNTDNHALRRAFLSAGYRDSGDCFVSDPRPIIPEEIS